jgi:hypothetical protein
MPAATKTKRPKTKARPTPQQSGLAEMYRMLDGRSSSPSAPRVRGAKMPKTSTSKATKTDFAGILRAALVRSDQTLYRVSMETGIGQDVLSRFVREERGLSLETASRLAMHLGYQLKRS